MKSAIFFAFILHISKKCCNFAANFVFIYIKDHRSPIIMKKIVSLLLILSGLNGVFASTKQVPAPSWYDDDWRASTYPHATYAQAFVEGEVKAGESIENAHQRMKEMAQAQTVQNIITSIEYNSSSVIQSSLTSNSAGFNEMTKEVFSSSTKIESAIKDIPNLSVESWHNPKTNAIYVFAWVNKKDLSRSLKKQIISNITRAEMVLEQVEQFISDGEKVTARKSIAKSIEHLQHVAECQKVVMAIESDAMLEDVMFEEGLALQKRATELYQQMKNGVYVYIGGQVEVFGEAYSTLVQQIKKDIADIGCTFSESKTGVDWVIELQGTTREYNTQQYGGTTVFFVYADVDMKIIKCHDNQTIFDGRFSEKGSHTLSQKEAAYAAYKGVLSQTTAKIKETINN